MEFKTISKEEIGNKINASRSAEIYEFGEDKVLKLYFPQYPSSDVEREYINTKEAFEKGATIMHVYDAIECEGRKGIVLEKINGVTQIEKFLKKFSYLFKAGKDLAELHIITHNQETDVLEDYKSYLLGLLPREQFNVFTEEEKTKLADYIKSLPDDNKIIHMDFHVNNVLVTEDEKFVVIDWMTALKGSPLAELSMMDFLLKQAELFPGISKIEAIIFTICKSILLKKFMRSYLKKTGIKKKEFKIFRASSLMFRFGTWNVESENQKIIKELKKFSK